MINCSLCNEIDILIYIYQSSCCYCITNPSDWSFEKMRWKQKRRTYMRGLRSLYYLFIFKGLKMEITFKDLKLTHGIHIHIFVYKYYFYIIWIIREYKRELGFSIFQINSVTNTLYQYNWKINSSFTITGNTCSNVIFIYILQLFRLPLNNLSFYFYEKDIERKVIRTIFWAGLVLFCYSLDY